MDTPLSTKLFSITITILSLLTSINAYMIYSNSNHDLKILNMLGNFHFEQELEIQELNDRIFELEIKIIKLENKEMANPLTFQELTEPSILLDYINDKPVNFERICWKYYPESEITPVTFNVFVYEFKTDNIAVMNYEIICKSYADWNNDTIADKYRTDNYYGSIINNQFKNDIFVLYDNVKLRIDEWEIPGIWTDPKTNKTYIDNGVGSDY